MSQQTDASAIVAVPASTDDVPRASNQTSKRGPRGGIYDPFPLKFHRALDQIRVEGMESIVSWVSHGRAFKIHKPKVFAATISKIRRVTLDGTIMSDSAPMSHVSFVRLDNVDARIGAKYSAEILQSIEIYQFPTTAEPLW
jgi:hypothetical protein